MRIKSFRFSVIFPTLFLIVSTAAGAATPQTPSERDDFRSFLAEVALCGAIEAPSAGGECLKQAIMGEPQSLKWLSDPSRLELLFQASRLDSEGDALIHKLRSTLKKNADVILAELRRIIPGMSFVDHRLLLNFSLPSLGLYLSELNRAQLNKIAEQFKMEILKKSHRDFRKVLAKFRPQDLHAFSGFFSSMSESTNESNARVKELTQNLITDYFASLTMIEKSKILSSFFRAPVDPSPAEKLRPLLQNLDVVMQKVFQLFGRNIKNPLIEEAVAILQSSLTPFSFDEIRGEAKNATGRSFEEMFTNVDSNPEQMHRASTGQVVFADVISSGDRAAVKGRAPHLKENFEAARLRLLGLPSVRENKGLSQFVEGMLEIIRVEIDYRNEAKYTDLAQKLYNDPKRGIRPLRRIAEFPPSEDFVVYAFESGVKPTRLTKLSDLKIRARLITNLIELWTETAFFKNIESDDATFAHTTLFHGDLHPGNILIDPKTETLVVLDFGNVGIFPLGERRDYAKLYESSTFPTPETLVDTAWEIYREKGLTDSDLGKLKKIGKEVWANPLFKESRLDTFLALATDEVGLPVTKAISSFMRGLAFLRIETLEINRLLELEDPSKKIERLNTKAIMKRTMLAGFRREFPKTLFGSSEEAFVDRGLFGKAIGSYLHSHFVQPCVNLLRRKE
ncbi:MAG: phosphotransferase [Cryobacterium sp.]|nr:phosphotransferase [Oligoflexia bacterium]